MLCLKVIHRLQPFSKAIHRTFVQHFTRFQLTVCSHGSSALAELLVTFKRHFGRINKTICKIPQKFENAANRLQTRRSVTMQIIWSQINSDVFTIRITTPPGRGETKSYIQHAYSSTAKTIALFVVVVNVTGRAIKQCSDGPTTKLQPTGRASDAFYRPETASRLLYSKLPVYALHVVYKYLTQASGPCNRVNYLVHSKNVS